MPKKKPKSSSKPSKNEPARMPEPVLEQKPEPPPARTSLDDAIEVRDLAKARVQGGDPTDLAKHVDAYTRAANLVRQLEKDRKRSLTLFSDDEIVEHLRGLPDRRREAIVIAVQGDSLAGKPLFG